MKIIGLCGGSGAGKTTVSLVMKLCGAEIIDTDLVYRELCFPGSACLSELKMNFGKEIILPDGNLDRKKLASIVYADDDKRTLLNTVTHRYIKEETVRRIAQSFKNGAPAVVIDAPLLFESGFDLLCDAKLGVLSDEALRIQRITARDNITVEHAKNRIAAQYSDEYLRSRCEYTLENNGEVSELVINSAKLYQKIISGIE